MKLPPYLRFETMVLPYRTASFAVDRCALLCGKPVKKMNLHSDTHPALAGALWELLGQL